MKRSREIETLEPLRLMSVTIQGTAGSDWISGNELDNAIFAGSGDDAIHAPLGNNQVDGGSGFDTFVVYEGDSNQFSLQQLPDGSFRLTGPGLHGVTVNQLSNIERVLFNDRAVELNAASDADRSPDIAETQSPSVPVNEPVEVPSFERSINGTNGDDWISGTGSDDTINAGAGNDAIHAPLGNNFIDGGLGTDSLVVYEGVRSDYRIEDAADGVRVTGPGLNGQFVTNTLQNVEFIDFNDGRVSIEAAQQASLQEPAPQPEAETPSANGNDGFGQLSFVETQLPELAAPEPTPAAPSVGAFELEVVRLTNIQRANFGLAPLTINTTLTQVAEAYSTSLANGDFFSHVGQDGRLPWDRVTDAGYTYRFVGENIAAGQRTPAEVVTAWMNSPSHRANILNSNYQEIGIGYVLLPNDFGNLNFNHYWTQLFGTQL